MDPAARTYLLLALGTHSERLVLPRIFADKSPGTLGPLPPALLHTPLDSPQHLSRQHEIDQPEAGAHQHAKQAWPIIDARPQDQPRRAGIHFVEDEHPAKLALNFHLRMVAQKIRYFINNAHASWNRGRAPGSLPGPRR